MPKVSGSYQGDGIQAVLLALGILDHFAKQRGALGITELARHFGTSKNRIHRHLQTLIEGGYVIRDAGGDRYRLSARLIALGEAVSEDFDIAVAARPALSDLHSALGHSVALSVPEPDGVRIIAVLRSASNIEIGVKQGSLLPYYGSSQGKVSLAFGSEELYERAVSHGMSANTPATIADWDVLAAELTTIRSRGWATATDQTVLGFNALAAPIFNGLGELAGAVAIVDSSQLISDEPSPDQLHAVLDTADRVSQTLGYGKKTVSGAPNLD